VDHPLNYGPFEGVIPAGNYEAGPVMLWDSGEFVFLQEARSTKEKPPADAREAFRHGVLKFELKGKKCKGKWALSSTIHLSPLGLNSKFHRR
jgi:bifunctional non-homologous end joining protein LigD